MSDRQLALVCAAVGILLLVLMIVQNRKEEGLLLLLLALAAAGALLYRPVEQAKRQKQRRREALDRDYVSLVTALNLYMTAGLSLRSSWDCCIRDAQERQEAGGEVKPVFEEMRITRKEMLGGVFEDQAYGRFGRRCGTPAYLKLGSLLETYVRQGNRELFTALQQESANALSRELQQVRRRGEENGTVLLVPVILLFAVTLLLVIVPAFMQMKEAL